jgi:hypothetical protein
MRAVDWSWTGSGVWVRVVRLLHQIPFLGRGAAKGIRAEWQG